MATYLDNAGVTQILTKIKSLLAKKAEITAIPTKTSQLTNDSYYQTEYDVNTKIGTELGKLDYDGPINSNDPEEPTFYISNVTQKDGKISATRNRFLYAWDRAYLKSIESNIAISSQGVDQKISEAVGKITSFEYKVVDSLPSTSEGKKGVVYLVAHSGSTTNNVYDEYIFLPAEGSTAARYEKIGTTDIDLTPYAKKTEIPTKVSQLTNDENYATQNYAYNTIRDEITDLDYSDTAVAGQYVSSVSETDGVIRVTRASLPAVGTADSPISNTTIESIFSQVFG